MGGLPKTLDGTGRLSVVRPARSKCRAAILGSGGRPYGVKQGQSGTLGDCRGLWRTAGDSTGGYGTARVMSHHFL